MAINLKHAFVSAKSDGTDVTLVQPSNWNASHTLTAALNVVLGTDGASTTVQELSCTAAGRALIDDADAATQRTTLGLGTLATHSLGDGSITYATIVNVTHGKILGRFTASAGVVEEVIIPLGQCQLVKNGANLQLNPYNGNRLVINSLIETVPDAGVTLTTGGLPASAATYYIYAFMNAGTMTLEAVSTAYAIQAGTGVTIKSGDGTRTLVGMGRTTAAPAWSDTAAQRWVRSWYNDLGISLLNNYSANRTTVSAAYVEVDTEIRVEFLVWTGETINLSSGGSMSGSTTQISSISLGIDGATAEDTYNEVTFVSGSFAQTGFHVEVQKSGLSEGNHFATLLGKTTAGTLNLRGSGTAGTRTSLRGFARR